MPPDFATGPSVVPDAVEGEEDGDGAVDGDGERVEKEPAAIPQAHAVVDVGAVVVELGDTTVTDAAVLGSEWPAKDFSASITYIYHKQCFARSGLEDILYLQSTIVDIL